MQQLINCSGWSSSFILRHHEWCQRERERDFDTRTVRVHCSVQVCRVLWLVLNSKGLIDWIADAAAECTRVRSMCLVVVQSAAHFRPLTECWTRVNGYMLLIRANETRKCAKQLRRIILYYWYCTNWRTRVVVIVISSRVLTSDCAACTISRRLCSNGFWCSAIV